MKAGVPKGEGRLSPRDARRSRRGPGRAARGRDAGPRRPIPTAWRSSSRPSAPGACSSTSSATAGASRKPRTRRCSTWPTRSASGPWPRTACATRRRAAGRCSTCSPASARSSTLATAGRLLSENAERHLKSPAGRWRRSSPTARTCSRNTEALAERLRVHARGPGLPLPRLPGAGGRDAALATCAS